MIPLSPQAKPKGSDSEHPNVMKFWKEISSKNKGNELLTFMKVLVRRGGQTMQRKKVKFTKINQPLQQVLN